MSTQLKVYTVFRTEKVTLSSKVGAINKAQAIKLVKKGLGTRWEKTADEYIPVYVASGEPLLPEEYNDL